MGHERYVMRHYNTKALLAAAGLGAAWALPKILLRSRHGTVNMNKAGKLILLNCMCALYFSLNFLAVASAAVWLQVIFL